MRPVSGEKMKTSSNSGKNEAGKTGSLGEDKYLQGKYPRESSGVDSSKLPTEKKAGELEKKVTLKDTSDGLPTNMPTKTFQTGSEDKAPSFSFLRPESGKIDKGGVV